MSYAFSCALLAGRAGAGVREVGQLTSHMQERAGVGASCFTCARPAGFTFFHLVSFCSADVFNNSSNMLFTFSFYPKVHPFP